MLRARALAFGLAIACLTLTPRVHAADILFVSDAGGDSEIPTVLTLDGHTVTTVSLDYAGGMNPALRVDLADYDAVYWSASGGGSGSTHTDTAAFANLTAYATDGGRVFVTGYDSIASPTDPSLIAFIGGTGSVDGPGTLSAVIAAETSLGVGVVDIRGQVPSGGYGDQDGLTGLTTGTIAVVMGSSGAAWTLRTIGSGEIVYVSNGASGTGATPSWTTTASGGAGAYNAALRNFAAAAEGAAREPGAPIIELESGYQADEGAAITITVSVTDEEGDAVTWSWDTDDDGTFDELAGEATYTIAAGTTDGDDSVRVVVRASDGTHTSERARTIRIVNVEPRITSTPPTQTSVGALVSYAIVVLDPGGAYDPLSYRLVRGPMGANVTDAGLFLWSPTDLDVTLPSESTTIEVAVDDGDGGATTQTWEMMVSPNRAPDGLTLLYPANGVVIADPAPRLVVGNGSDPDPMDTLRYFFELDDEPTFAEPLLLESGEVAEGTGYTAFELATALPPGEYFWRAWMSDGAAETERESTSFTVVPDPRVDGGPIAENDGAVADRDAGIPEPMMEPRSGCAVGAAGRGGSSTIALALAGLALVIVARRRRR